MCGGGALLLSFCRRARARVRQANGAATHAAPPPSLTQTHTLFARAPQVIDASYANEAYKRMEKGDVKFRFVIDVNKSIIG